jgi:hypothetical protein
VRRRPRRPGDAEAAVTVETLAPTTYAVTISAAERELLLAAIELAIAAKRGAPEAAILLADIDADRLDGMGDSLWLAGAPAITMAPWVRY